MLQLGLGLSLPLANNEGGGGSPSFPVWVLALRAPSGDLPNVVSLFDTDQHWNFMDGVCTLTDNWPASTSLGTWDPTSVVPGQGVTVAAGDSQFPNLADEYFSALPYDMCMVVAGNIGVTGAGNVGYGYYDASFANGAYAQMTTGAAQGIYSYSPTANLFETWGDSPQFCKSAWNYTHSSGEGSAQGGAYVTLANTTYSDALTGIEIYVQASGADTCWIKSCVIYPLQPDADLPTLSTP